MSSLNKLLLIDPQNDFCDTPLRLRPVLGEVVVDGQRVLVSETPALPVTGGHEDMLRTAEFIRRVGPLLNRIVVTMDSHPFVAIERTTFWRDADGKEVAPFTEITADSVLAGKFTPAQANAIEPINGKPLAIRVVELLQMLEASGRFKLMAWPVHCVTGSWGAALHPAIGQVLNQYERSARFPVRKVAKGEYPLAEHYGVFEAETPLADVPSTRFNGALADELTSDITIIAGLAGSHCVPASYFQLIKYRKTGKGIVILTDCMSPVTGFEQAQADFFTKAKEAGSVLMTSAEAISFLSVRA